MGANMTERLVRGGHHVVGYDRSAEAVAHIKEHGAAGAASLEDLAGALERPRAVWLMVPAGAPVDSSIDALLPLLARDDVIIDGGNSYYRDSLRRHQRVQESGIHYVDAGVSGGVWGLREGYSLMVGGDDDVVARLRPIFETLAPAHDQGWGHVGPAGAGHFVKMVHNGIEYGLMQSYAEGFAVLQARQDFHLDLAQVAEIWRFGSVIRSWLLDLTADALHADPALSSVAPYVEDSGEGRWTVEEAVDLNIPAPVITLSLMARLRSRIDDSFADRLLAIMRNEFGGHAVKKVD
jgi:6-phosphogluconate dehydrogenase